jgi:hypothetical protein
VYATKLIAAAKPMPAGYDTWPVWEMIAATVAFFAWAFGMPQSPFRALPWYSAPLAAFAILFASVVLGLIGPLFQRKPLGTGQ